MSLLFATHPLIVNPDLAVLIGLNEAMVLQQVHYWLKDTSSGVEIKGQRWIYNTAEEWLEQFPFWSESTIKRAITSLKALGLLNVEQQGKKNRDMTNYFSINYDNDMLTSKVPHKPLKQAKAQRKRPSSQNDQMDVVNLNSPISSDCTDASSQNDQMEQVKMTRSIGSKWHDDLTETTTEITTENKKPSCPDAPLPDESPGENLSEADFISRHPQAVVCSARKRQWGGKDDLTCAEFIWSKIIAMYEQAAETCDEVAKPKEPNWAAWANEIRLMVAQDGRTHKQICSLFKRANQDVFWCKNILSPSKLREKWDELSLKLSTPVETQTRPAGYVNMDFSKQDYSSIPKGFRGGAAS